jgi:uncharacterized membrane protein YfcA
MRVKAHASTGAAVILLAISAGVYWHKQLFPEVEAADYGVAISALAAAVMGARVALKPPRAEHQTYWFWAFVLVGLAAMGLNLLQTSNNQTLG